MAEFKLKPGQERFQVVEGPCANRCYLPGVVYKEIPENEANRFEEILSVAAPVAVKKSKATEVDNA